ncbi:hypothetical protein GCM10009836_18810 [Pseudonocardia ailaonensis]|uniref:Uncharacterized protein n=1 Tax=Pseudonocardia ailaonensis TaxID=367279 RepID=A0ABN2MV48_9PSEU
MWSIPRCAGTGGLVALLEAARAEDVEVVFAESPRSLRELKAIHDEVLRAHSRFQELGVRAAGLWIDPATATVVIHVADSSTDVVRRLYAHHGSAVAVTGNGPVDLSERLPHTTEPRDDWPVPTLAPDDAAGRATEEVAELYRSEGFEVEFHHLGDPYGLESSLDPNRIRLLVHDGHVVDATRG